MRNRSIIAAAVVTGAAVLSACERSGPAGSVSEAGNFSVPNAVRTAGSQELDAKTRQALLDALADERRAEATYKAAIAQFGDVRPFSNIVNAERRHEEFLIPLFDRYGIPVPENEITRSPSDVPATLTEACQAGIEGEKANIAMYDKFLEFVTEPQIREVFTYLRGASKDNHLPAFERCVSGPRMRRGMNN